MSTQYLQHENGTLAYDDAGTGSLVVCVPGLGDVRASFRFLGPQLVAAGYRVVTLDLRGHGESSTGWADYSDTAIGRDVLALLAHLHAGPAVLIGNSYGGAAIAYAAAVAPDAVAGLMLLDAFLRDHPQTLVQRIAVWLISRPVIGPNVWTTYYKSLYKTRQPADFAEYLAALKANLRQPGRFAATRAMMYGNHRNVAARLGDVHAPALVVMGSKDPDFPDPAAEARWMADQLHGTVQMIDGAGHYPHAEMPTETGAAIIKFMHHIQEPADYVA